MNPKLKEIGIFLLQIILSIYLLFEFFAFLFHKGMISKEDIKNHIKKEGFLASLKYLLMPTRMRSEIIKEKNISKFATYMKNMTLYSLIITLIISIGFMVAEYTFTTNNFLCNLISDDNIYVVVFGYLFLFIVFLWSISRIFEIFYAFFRDAYTHLEDRKEGELETNLKYHDRIHLAMYSYAELILLFGIFFYALSSLSSDIFLQRGSESTISIVDAIYFSGVTITTLGYGDISPNMILSQISAVFEVISGFILIIVSFTIYVSRAIREMDLKNENEKLSILKEQILLNKEIVELKKELEEYSLNNDDKKINE